MCCGDTATMKNNWSTPWHQTCFAAVKEWGSLSLLTCLPLLDSNNQRNLKHSNQNQRHATGPCCMQDIRFALPIIGAEEASTLLGQGFPDLRSSGLHHLGLDGFFCGVKHDGFTAAGINHGHNVLQDSPLPHLLQLVRLAKFTFPHLQTHYTLRAAQGWLTNIVTM